MALVTIKREVLDEIINIPDDEDLIKSRTSRIQEVGIEKAINHEQKVKIETKLGVRVKDNFKPENPEYIEYEEVVSHKRKSSKKTVNEENTSKRFKNDTIETIENVIVDSESVDDSTNDVSESDEMMYINEANKKIMIFRSKYSIEYDSLGYPLGINIYCPRKDIDNVEDAMKIWGKDRIGSTFEEAFFNFFTMKNCVTKILCKEGYVIKLNSVEDLDKFDDVMNTELKFIGLDISKFRLDNIEKVLKGLDLIQKKHKKYY